MRTIQIVIIFLLLGVSTYEVNASANSKAKFCERDCSMEYKFFNEYAREGSPLAYFSMAIMNYKGHGREINIELANRQLLISAKKEEPVAMFQLAYNLLFGLYNEQDIERSYRWFKRAETSGVLKAERFVTLLDKVLEGEKNGLNQSRINFSNQIAIDKKETFFDPIGIQTMEIITIEQMFQWDFVLYNARIQTCNHSCLSPSKHAFLPLISLVNESNLLKQFEMF